MNFLKIFNVTYHENYFQISLLPTSNNTKLICKIIVAVSTNPDRVKGFRVSWPGLECCKCAPSHYFVETPFEIHQGQVRQEFEKLHHDGNALLTVSDLPENKYIVFCGLLELTNRACVHFELKNPTQKVNMWKHFKIFGKKLVKNEEKWTIFKRVKQNCAEFRLPF